MLQVPVLHEPGRVALIRLETRHDFRCQESDIVGKALLGSNEACGSGPAAKTCQDVRDEEVVEISREGECIERSLGESSLRASACGGRRLSADAAHEVHKELRELLVVERAVAGEVRKACNWF